MRGISKPVVAWEPVWVVAVVDDVRLLSQLEALAHRLGVEIRYESLEGEGPLAGGGLCRLREKMFIIVNERFSAKEKVRTLAHSLKRFDLSNIYVKPALRDLLENQSGEQGSACSGGESVPGSARNPS